MATIIGYNEAIDMRSQDDWGLAVTNDLINFLNNFEPTVWNGSKGIGLNDRLDFLSLILDDSPANPTNFLFVTLSNFTSSNTFNFYEFKAIPGPGASEYYSLKFQGNFSFDTQKMSGEYLTPAAIDSINGIAETEILSSAAGPSIKISGVNESLADPTDSTTPDSVFLSGPDTITGSSLSDYLMGYAGNDNISGSRGSDVIDGGDGTDIAIYTSFRSLYTIAKSSAGVEISESPTNFDVEKDAPEQLINVERIKFVDGSLALDVGQWQTAGEAYRLYRAAFTRTPDNAGLKYWIAQLDNGQSNVQVAHNFIASAEFQSLYGANPTSSQLVTAMYQNTLNRAPDQGGFDYWKGLLDNKQITSEQLLINFSESSENVAAVGVTINNGIWLT